MLFGKSILHVNQTVGKYYSDTEISGYYNDLREKVIKDKKTKFGEVPMVTLDSGETVEFPTAIFQYGLGAYDLFLETKEEKYREICIIMAEWAMKNQSKDGGWSNFYFIYPNSPYSCMSQGEGSSLLLRAYNFTKDASFLTAAKKAIDFMLRDISDGGTAINISEGTALCEYTNKKIVLNGWAFGLFGLFDYMLFSKDIYYEQKFFDLISTLKKSLYKFDVGYWSYYNIDGSIMASRFYHKLHIALLSVLGVLSKDSFFISVSEKWKQYDANIFYRSKSFFIKAKQKIIE